MAILKSEDDHMGPARDQADAEVVEAGPAQTIVENRSGEAGAGGSIRGFVTGWRWWWMAVLVAAIFLEVAWLTFLTPGEADLAHYECYGLTFWLGSHGASLLPQTYCAFLGITTPQPAFHLLPLEYPPLTIFFFSLPLLAPLPDYALVFALLMTVSAGLMYWLLACTQKRVAALLFAGYLLLGTVGVFQERFDLLPAICTLGCLLAAERGRWRLAYLALALGVLLKLYPLVLLPALFLAEQRAWLSGRTTEKTPQTGFAGLLATIRSWNWRNSLLCVGLIVAVMGGFALVNVQDAILSPLFYFLDRPPQIESLVASITWLGGYLNIPYQIVFTFGSLNLTGNLTHLLSPLDTVLTLAGLLTIFWLQWRQRLSLAQSLTGLLCVLIATGKVFSPQYLIWFIPLLAVIAARGQTNRLWLIAWAIISLLTTFIYIFYYSRMPDPQTAQLVVRTLPGFFELVALRNLLLVVTTLAYVGGWWEVRGNGGSFYTQQG